MGVPLKLVLSLLVTLAVVVASLASFLPMYFSGLDSVESAVDNIRRSIIDCSQRNIRTFFKQGSDSVEMIQRASFHSAIDFENMFDTQPYENIVNLLHNTINKSEGTFNSAFVKSAGYRRIEVDARETQGPGSSTVFHQVNGSGVNVLNFIRNNETTTEFDRSRGYFAYSTPRRGIPDRELGFLNGTGWQRAFFSFDDVKITVAGPYYTDKTVTGIYGVGVLPRDINRYLQTIGLREGGRAVVFEAIGEGTMLANSWNQSNANIISISAVGSRRVGELIPLQNVSDPLMQKVVSTYGIQQLVNGAAPFAVTMGDSESDRTYVDVIEVTDEYGLKVRVIVAMPLSDFLGDYYDSRITVIIIVVAAVVVLVLVSIGVSIALTRPLNRLGFRMALTASLKDAGADDKTSALSEIAAMQKSYTRMKDELQRMKSFLPQSLLQEEDDSMEGSHSNTGSENPFLPKKKMRHHDSIASGDASRLEISANLGVNAYRLRAANNTFTAEDCAVVVVSAAYGAPFGTQEHAALMEDLLHNVVQTARKHRGIIEIMKPQQIIISFGARRKITNPSGSALKFTLALNRIELSPAVEISMLLDRGTFFVGSCGSEELREETIHSYELDVLTSLGPLVHSAFRCPIAATGRIAPSLTERCVVFPIDSVQWAEQSRVQIFGIIGVRKEVVDSCDKRIVPKVKRGFGLLCNGDHTGALEELKLAMEMIPDSILENSSTKLAMNAVAEADVFYSGIYKAIAAMVATTKTMLGSTQPYARRYLGWPTVDGPSPFMPVFDTRRCEQQGQPDDRLAGQLSELARLKEGRQPRFQSKPDNAEASGLFEMAFAYGGEADVFSVTNSAASQSEPSPSATFGSITGGGEAEVIAPAAQNYLRQWRRGENMLGKGTFGSVYRALNDNGSIAAMKILPLASSSTSIDDLRKELLVAAGQRHENLVAFVDADVNEEELVVIMELLPGGSLEGLVKDFGQLPSRVIRRFVVDILRGLAHLHRAGIVHCDVKPQNVLVGVDGVAKVADFGSVLHPGFDSNHGEDDGGDLRVPGTPAYMAPEVARGGAPTPASDIWGFGIMVHDLVARQRPFNAKQLQAMSGGAFKCISAMGGIREDGSDLREPPRVQLPDGTHDADAIQRFLEACLAVDPAKRATCESLLTMEYLL